MTTLLVTLLLVTTALVAVGGPAKAAPYNEPQYVGSIGQPGRAGVYAWGMATAANGNLIVGDYWNYRMLEYTVEGALVQTFGERGDGDGQNNAPHGIGVNPVNGDIYVSDLNNGNIDHFTADGTWIEDLPTWQFDPVTFELLTTPIPYAPRLAFDSNGWSYMVNSHTFPSPEEFTHRIIIRDSEWGYLGYIGELGDFGVLRGVAVAPDDSVYIVDAGRGVIHRFERDLESPDLAYNQLADFGAGYLGGDARGITIDGDNGWVYVVDAFASQIEKFDLEGNHLLTWGSEGEGPGQFRDGGRELTLAADPRPGFESAPPVVAVADFGNTRVNVYDSDGTFLWDFPNPPAPPPDNGFNQIQDVAVSPDGSSVYTADTFNHRVQKFSTATGALETLWGYRGSSADGTPYAMNYPRGIAVDPDNGDVWLNNTREGDIQVYDADGNFKFMFGSWGDGPEQYNYSRGIEIEPGPAGRVFIADGVNRRIHIVDKTGAMILNIDCAPDSTALLLTGCSDVAVAADGSFFAASVDEGVIYTYAPDGTLTGSFGQLGSGPGELRGPYGLAIYDGRVYVSEAWNDQISVFEFDGTFVDSFGSLGSGPGELEQPKGIDIVDGMLYVADHFNERIQVWNLGTGSIADIIDPTADVGAPPAGSTVLPGTVQLSGTAGDNVGVGSVQIAIQNTGTSLWLQPDGTWLGAMKWLDALVDAPGAAAVNWTREVTLPSSSYGLRARAIDTSANTGVSSWRAFATDGGEPINTSLPTITGTAEVGEGLSAIAGSWTGVEPITFEYQWQRCPGSCSNIAGATSSTYTVGNDDVGSSLTVVETATSIAGTTTATALETAVVPGPPEAPLNVALPVVSGTVDVGEQLTTTDGMWTGTDPIAYSYQWQRCSGACSDISGETGSTYTVASGDVGFSLTVVETGTNVAGSSTATADETAVVPGPGPANTFTDDDGSVHEAAIEAIAAAGITLGCNPPTNDEFCPDDPVTRGAMAAFLNRALSLATTGIDYFTDDDTSVFEGDINRLAAAGITKGCNPPTNDQYCPDDPVTRGAMAAFLNRALSLDATGLDFFSDDDGSVFEGDINRLAAAGITLGCNPPANDEYCPNRVVTRAEMATFLARALDLDV